MKGRWSRQVHRWLAGVFVVMVLVNIGATAAMGTPPEVLTYAPLLPLGILLLTGLPLLAEPYFRKRRLGDGE